MHKETNWIPAFPSFCKRHHTPRTSDNLHTYIHLILDWQVLAGENKGQHKAETLIFWGFEALQQMPHFEALPLHFPDTRYKKLKEQIIQSGKIIHNTKTVMLLSRY